MTLRPLLVLLIFLTGCTAQSAMRLQCDAACRMEIDRGVDTKAPTP